MGSIPETPTDLMTQAIAGLSSSEGARFLAELMETKIDG